MTGIDDLARALQPPSGEVMAVGQATILQWNAETFENTLDYDGLTLHNVPVASGVEALTYRPRDVVMLEQWYPGGQVGERGIGTAWIRGRVLTPGAGAAEQAIEFLRGALVTSIIDDLVAQLLTSPAGRALAAGIFADRIHSETTSGSVSSLGSTYATGNPSVTVEVTEARRALVFLTAYIGCTKAGGAGADSVGHMGFVVSGASSLGAFDNRSLANRMGATVAGSFTNTPRSTAVYELTPDQLTSAGSHAFTAAYRATHAGGAATVNIADRGITVIAF